MPKVPPSAKRKATREEQDQAPLHLRLYANNGVAYTRVKFRKDISIADLKMSYKFEKWLDEHCDIDVTVTPIPVGGGELAVKFFGSKGEYARTNTMERSLIESFVIQQYGGNVEEPCERCKKGFIKQGQMLEGNQHPDGLVYEKCQTIPALAGGACGSCKRAHKEAECTASAVFQARIQEEDRVKQKREDSSTQREKRNAARTTTREAAEKV